MGHIENLKDYRVELNLDQRLDQRTYNMPLTSEVAVVWVEGSERHDLFEHSVLLQGKDRSIHGIRSYNACYDALSYPVFFPMGELGWHNCIPKVGVTMAQVDQARAICKKRAENGEDYDGEPVSNTCVFVHDYYCYKFQMRPGIFNPILYGRRLFQQFTIDTYIKIESSCLDYMRNNQDTLRADLYQGLVDSMHLGEGSAKNVGRRTVLSSSFIGGPHDMRHRYMDAMALVQKYGKPDIFLTMTCNPNWDEIKNELYPGQTPQDRPDLVTWVFRAKLEAIRKMLMEKDILGKVKAYGHDRASVVMRETDKADEKGNIDEIKQYRDAWWVTPLEALWMIYGFDLSKNHPPVQQLQLHLPDMHMVVFHKWDKVERIVNRPGVEESMLTAYFDANRHHEEARGILYRDFPEHFTWQSDGKFWQKRKNSIFQVGRVISAQPAKGECYFICVLLNNVAGATSYEHLRTVDGVLLPLFCEAAERRGLIEEDNTLDECLTEATLFQMPSSLRRLFATILVFYEPQDVMGL
ncbi:uncharacterized protein [Miscanthus floridulus]|uniref:uncharacterized protein n=1 Tax=Miscanthus floridulus TaxID=154761 RepID=UPI003458B1CE